MTQPITDGLNCNRHIAEFQNVQLGKYMQIACIAVILINQHKIIQMELILEVGKLIIILYLCIGHQKSSANQVT